MKTYKFLINGVNYEATVLEYSSSHAKISVNGHEHLINIVDDEQNKVPKLEGFERSTPQPPQPIVPVTPAAPVAPAAPKPVVTAGDNILRAPIPGVIIDVMIREGQTVADGDVALILEAMKMESDIHFFQSGRVKTIYVQKGDSVQEGDPLVELEA